jgi:hypothetical protein
MRKSGTSVEMELDNVWINKGTNNGFWQVKLIWQTIMNIRWNKNIKKIHLVGIVSIDFALCTIIIWTISWYEVFYKDLSFSSILCKLYKKKQINNNLMIEKTYRLLWLFANLLHSFSFLL